MHQSQRRHLNSDDGVAELVGSIDINGVQAFSFNKTKAEVGKEFLAERPISSAYYYGGNGSFTSVRGVIEDRGQTSGNDTMWIANRKINLQQILDSHNEFLIKGDHDSESADLRFVITKSRDIY